MNNNEIPLPPDYVVGAARNEIDVDGFDERHHTAGDAMCELTEHEGNDDVLNLVLDWASQIREREHLGWGDSIRAAMIFYYG